MRDKVHTEEIKIRLTEDYKRKLLNLYRRTGISPAVLARAFINKAIDDQLAEVSIQTGENKGRLLEGLRGDKHGTQNAA